MWRIAKKVGNVACHVDENISVGLLPRPVARLRSNTFSAIVREMRSTECASN